MVVCYVGPCEDGLQCVVLVDCDGYSKCCTQRLLRLAFSGRRRRGMRLRTLDGE
jgi:hypothetical protein